MPRPERSKPARVVMLYRGGVRNHPRVTKAARTLAQAGCRVVVVAMKVPGESQAVERLEGDVVVARTATGLLSRFKHRRSGGAADAGSSAGADPGAAEGEAPRISRPRLALMVISRTLIALKMAGLAVRARPDAVHAHDFSTLFTGWMVATLRRVPLIYDAHEVNVDREGYYRQLRWLVYRMESLLITRCDRVVTTTELRARHFRRLYRLKQTPLVLQNRPVYRRVPPSDDLRSSRGIPEEALLCLYQGGLQEGRGLHNLVRAVAASDRVHCVLLGEGHQKLSLLRLAQELGVAGRVHHHPQVALGAVAAITAAADVGVQVIRNTCFNHWSTDSNKLFEYVMAGLPVVASDFPEIRKVVVAHHIGLLVDPHAVDQIAGALQRLRDEPDLRSRLTANARTAGPALSWETQAPALIALYQSLGMVSCQAPAP